MLYLTQSSREVAVDVSTNITIFQFGIWLAGHQCHLECVQYPVLIHTACVASRETTDTLKMTALCLILGVVGRPFLRVERGMR
jgi:hypothetical protein